MSSEIAISVENVGKAYRLWESPSGRLSTPFLGLMARLFSAVPSVQKNLQARAKRKYRDFWALQNVSLQVTKGESMAIIGRNGSGKSTLLQIIVGTLQPSTGSAKVK